jgi:tetratricopeptide (TPR) repeat protein
MPKSRHFFAEQLMQALNHFHEPDWLGEQSPLATPYFLGEVKLDGRLPGAVEQGKALQRALLAAFEALWQESSLAQGSLAQQKTEIDLSLSGEKTPQRIDAARRQVKIEAFRQAFRDKIRTANVRDPGYQYYLLDLAYFQQYLEAKSKQAAFESLGVSKSRYYDQLEGARRRLEEILLRREHPTFRLEQPVLSTSLIGVEPDLENCLAHLRAGKSVAVQGAGGVGKTSLGLAIRQRWPDPAAVFWYTLRANLPNQLASLIFSLAHFCYEHGQTALWSQVMVEANAATLAVASSDARKTAQEITLQNPVRALGFLRHDLKNIAGGSIYLCFDEMEALRPFDIEETLSWQHQMVEFLEGLQDCIPVLYLGQRIPLVAEVHITLNGLAPGEVALFFQRAGKGLTVEQTAQLHDLTLGNPRSLGLCLQLYAEWKGSFAAFMASLSGQGTIRPLFDRLWRKLDDAERDLLCSLAVHLSAAPRSLAQDQPGVIERLEGRGLIRADSTGGLLLDPFFKHVIYEELPTERKEHYQRRAALLRASLGEYSDASYHWVEAGDYALAIHIWTEYQDLEIQRGRAKTAQAIFRSISIHRLNEADQRRLQLIRNRLDLLSGDVANILSETGKLRWPEDQEESADAFMQMGWAYRVSGRAPQGREAYQKAIEQLARVERKIVQAHAYRAWSFKEDSDLPLARQEVTRARCEVEYLEGTIEFGDGKYATAEIHLQAALTLANLLQDNPLLARTLTRLSMLRADQHRTEESCQYAQEAIRRYETLQDQFQAERVRSELGCAYLLSKEYTKAIEYFEPSLAYFKAISAEQMYGSILTNLASAYEGLDRLDEAERYARECLATEHEPSRPYAFYALGRVAYKRNDCSGALRFLEQSLESARRAGKVTLEPDIHAFSGEVYQAQGKYGLARTELETALQQYQQLELDAYVADTEELLRKLTIAQNSL